MYAGSRSVRERSRMMLGMGAPYQDLVAQLRTAFPAPVSDRVHDAYFVFSFLRALDQVDALKGAAPMLGQPCTLDYEAARAARVPTTGSTLEAVTSTLDAVGGALGEAPVIGTSSVRRIAMLRRLWPQARTTNLLEDSLAPDLAAAVEVLELQVPVMPAVQADNTHNLLAAFLVILLEAAALVILVLTMEVLVVAAEVPLVQVTQQQAQQTLVAAVVELIMQMEVLE